MTLFNRIGLRTAASVLLGLALTALLGACNGAPATVVVVVTNTPNPNVIQVTVTPNTSSTTSNATSAPTTQENTGNSTAGATSTTNNASATNTNSTPITVPPTQAANPAPTNAPTNTPDPRLAEVHATLYIAQQDFENGYMFWISSQKKVWVLFNKPKSGDQSDVTTGEWQAFPDIFVDGEPEIDASLVAPSADRYQPRRGFGKLWRTTPGLKDALGWAKTPEFALNTQYSYRPAGHTDDKGQWVQDPGIHTIVALDRKIFVLHEPAPGQQRGTWEKLP